MIRIFKQFILVILICAGLGACNDKSESSATDTLNVSTPASSYVLQLGNSVTVPVTFTASSGTLSNLTVTGLSALPHAWSMQNGGNAFTCTTIPANGTGCQLNLVFAPTNTNQDDGTLVLHYTYVNSNGQNQAGQFSIPYAVLNTVVPSINPTPSINTTVGSSQNVFITFAASPSATTATDLQVTSDLAQLPAGWSVIGGASSFGCKTVQGINGCQLGLVFQPNAANQSEPLTLNYSYHDNDGALQQGSLSFQYQATTNSTVLGSIFPASTVTQAVSSSLPVSITYTTSAGQEATHFRITSGLDNLNALGWNGPSSFTCPTVTNTNGCQLSLNFTPTSFDQDGTLNLVYSYDDSAGLLQTGTTKINYSPTSMDILQASMSSASPITAFVSQSIPVTLTFTDNTTATNLQVIGLNNLPSSWRQINGTLGSFNCATVSIGNGCQLSLQFSPTDTLPGMLTLGYSYNNGNGTPLTGHINLQYHGTTDNNAIYTANPPAPLTTLIGTSYPVSVVFTTDDNQPATQLVMDLSELTTNNPGWSSTNASTFTCSSFSTSGGCTLALTYSPTTSGSSTLSLPYHYQDNNGDSKTGTFSYAYNTGNIVMATVDPNPPIQAKVTLPTSVTVNFTTNNSHTASGLQIPASSLPAGWSASLPFDCETIPASGGTGCSLTLTYTPTAVTTTTALSLNYSFTDDDGKQNTGTLSIPYSASLPVFAYIINNVGSSNTQVTKCAVNSDGTLTSCTPAGSGLAAAPTGIAISTINGNTYAYLSSDIEIQQCTISANNGNFSTNCPIAYSNFVADISDITLQTIVGATYAYIPPNISAGAVTKCTVNNSSGSLSQCGNTSNNSFSITTSIAFQTASNGNTYAYLINSNGVISVCQVQSDGSFPNCTPTTTGVSGANGGIAFLTASNGNTYAYLSTSGYTVMQCIVNADGTLGSTDSPCASTGSSFSQPVGIAFQTAGTATYAYVVNNSNNTIERCLVNPDGTLGSTDSPCVSTGSNLSQPLGIAFH